MPNSESRNDTGDQPTQSELDTAGDDFHIVGIGASAGGLEALERFFDAMPADSGMAFVVVQHLSPDFKSLMDELLARHTKMSIYRVEGDMHVRANGIYLIPPRKNMIISERQLRLIDQVSTPGLNLPINLFFQSLASDLGHLAIGVVLSGTGSDGTRGLQDIHEQGGLVAVQDIETAGFDGMPRNAIATGMARIIAPPAEIAQQLCKYIADPTEFQRGATAPEPPPLPGEEISTIFRLFRVGYGIDFNLYRESTIHRRIDRRMQLSRCATLADYVALLTEDSSELELLYRDLLVEVTRFFRDPQAFERLRDDVLPGIFKHAAETCSEIRVWVPGCATGEEAYSLAMLLDDFAARHGKRSQPIKVFATDVHRNSLEIASNGVFSSEAVASVPADIRTKYFTNHGTLYHVTRPIRQMVIFAPHDITRDPPFTKVDLISCRNVLIYFETNVQRRVLSLFHFGLRVDGVMLLGPSETTGDLATEFDAVDSHWRIFRKLRDVRLPDASSVRLANPLFRVINTPYQASFSNVGNPNDLLERRVVEDLLDRYVPPSFLVDKNMNLVHSFGEARQILVQPRGRPTLNVLKMVDGELKMALSAGLHRAIRENSRVALQGIRVEMPDGTRSVRLIVEPYKSSDQDLFLIAVEDTGLAVTGATIAESFDADSKSSQHIYNLERELEFIKESLQSTVEELETSNEELQSTNEELVASNEELQSTNEELHSVNEELYTVNAEYQRKIDELTQLTADMDNLIRSTEIGTIFLDCDLRIRRFTPAIASAFHILEQDVGRPISQFAYQFESSDWLDTAKQVIETGQPVETKLVSRADGRTLLKRMLPYRSAAGQTSGIVITFTDVTAISRVEEEQKQRLHLERVTRDLQDFAYAVSHDLHAPSRQIEDAVFRFRDQFGSTLSDDADEILTTVVSRTNRLRHLLDCLLEFSRVNTSGRPFEVVNSQQLVRSVLDSLAPQLQAQEAVVTMGDLPIVLGDSTQLQKVFWHVINNAIKYSSESPLQLDISARRGSDKWELTFSDNGIGIRPQHVDDVFIMFRRLGFKPDVPGDGIGLTLCRRILARHDGTISARARPAGGSEFDICLPILRDA
ncbi:MAG: PAS domain-containing protein [Planctomycetales bacterium]|nr:PAS domain-containing protein [Planctomycetales bacterium]MCA9166360.1 PAS domain-containing protein [Planctomycetales bacterium]